MQQCLGQSVVTSNQENIDYFRKAFLRELSQTTIRIQA